MDLLRLATLTGVLLATGALAAPERVVMVLYFDNNTGDKSLDVLQKGLADMLITDLSAQDTFQVVEREKLQAALDELNLQRTKYFDPKTAQKIGKGVGAQYAVTGAIAAMEPKLRLDIRLFEVSTLKVLLAENVVGTKDKFFELEAELVEKFLSKLSDKEGRGKSASRAGQTNVANLLLYSQALDDADKGDLKGASQKMAAIVRTAPEFSLAQKKYGELLRRVREAGKKRQSALSEAEERFLARIDAHLAHDPTKLEKDARKHYLGARAARGAFIIGQLKKLLGPPSVMQTSRIPPERRKEAIKLATDYADNADKYLAEIAAILEPIPVDKRWWEIDPELPEEDVRLGEQLGLGSGVNDALPSQPQLAMRTVANVLLFGKYGSHGLWVNGIRPTPAQLDPKLAKRALKYLSDGQKERIPGWTDSHLENLHADLLNEAAEGLVLLGRKEEAVAQWQLYLDTYPKGVKFAEFEGKIEDLLGTSPKVEEFEKQLDVCGSMLIGMMYNEITRRARADGSKGLRELERRLFAACTEPMQLLSMKSTFFTLAGMAAVERGDCDYVAELREKVMQMEPVYHSGFEQTTQGCK